ncbi:MAG: methyltransferase domain-containing protein [Caldilineaceae bacterium]|nr:methyltransferase domain-containing protein [Caldilineaceae bacterium]
MATPRLSNDRWVAEQYKTPRNLNARIQLHKRFSTNPYAWLHWVFDHLRLAPGMRVLEIGGGPGGLWQENRHRLSPQIEIFFTDQSTGMIAQALSLVGDLRQFAFAAADAQALPFAGASFDVVIANHMLYHVPDRKRALAEIRRVLKPTGNFFAATNDHTHMQELRQLAESFLPVPSHLVAPQETSPTERFPFDVATQELSQYFGQLQLHLYHNALVVTDADALADYMLSGITAPLPEEVEAGFRHRLSERIRADGAITVTSASGLFEAATAE